MAKPKPESKVIEEPKKPYEMTPLEVEAAQRVNGRLKGRPPAPWFPRRAARQTELARLGTVESDKTPGVYIRTGEAALADRLANAWAALARKWRTHHEHAEGPRQRDVARTQRVVRARA